MKLYRALYFVGVALIFVGGYRLFKHLSYGEYLFAGGVVLYAFVQLVLLFKQSIANWGTFEYLKCAVNLLFVLSVVFLLAGKVTFWYYPFILGLLLDFFANIFRKIQNR